MPPEPAESPLHDCVVALATTFRDDVLGVAWALPALAVTRDGPDLLVDVDGIPVRGRLSAWSSLAGGIWGQAAHIHLGQAYPRLLPAPRDRLGSTGPGIALNAALRTLGPALLAAARALAAAGEPDEAQAIAGALLRRHVYRIGAGPPGGPPALAPDDPLLAGLPAPGRSQMAAYLDPGATAAKQIATGLTAWAQDPAPAERLAAWELCDAWLLRQRGARRGLQAHGWLSAALATGLDDPEPFVAEGARLAADRLAALLLEERAIPEAIQWLERLAVEGEATLVTGLRLLEAYLSAGRDEAAQALEATLLPLAGVWPTHGLPTRLPDEADLDGLVSHALTGAARDALARAQGQDPCGQRRGPAARAPGNPAWHAARADRLLAEAIGRLEPTLASWLARGQVEAIDSRGFTQAPFVLAAERAAGAGDQPLALARLRQAQAIARSLGPRWRADDHDAAVAALEAAVAQAP
ncbi:MAG: hypothetical protein ACOYM9_26165 [Bradymonadia bacterium]|jgi:hypothetical protein